MKLLVCGTGSYRHGGTVGPARWPHHDLIVVTGGTLMLRCGEREIALLAHDALLIPPGTPFVGTAGESGCAIWVQHAVLTAAELPAALRKSANPEIRRGAAATEIVRALLRRLHQLRDGETAAERHLRQTLFRALLLELAQPVTSEPATQPAVVRLQPAIAWAETNPGTARGLRTMAGRARLSESHFRSLFRRLHGQPAGTWMRERRMEEACRLLRTTELTLKEIAARMGYSDVVSFNRAFARHLGTPPGRYRRTGPQVV
jgi:AraC-like DNA-binding protein